MDPEASARNRCKQLAIVRTLSWPVGMIWLAVAAVVCTPVVYANSLANYSLIRK